MLFDIVADLMSSSGLPENASSKRIQHCLSGSTCHIAGMRRKNDVSAATRRDEQVRESVEAQLRRQRQIEEEARKAAERELQANPAFSPDDIRILNRPHVTEAERKLQQQAEEARKRQARTQAKQAKKADKARRKRQRQRYGSAL